MRILILLPCQPFPAYNGQTHRLALTARSLAERHEVALACFVEPGQARDIRASERDLFVETRQVDLAASPAGFGEMLGQRLSASPADVFRFRSVAMADHVASLVTRYDPEAILLGDPALTPYVEPYAGRVVAMDYVCEVTLQLERIAALAGPLERPLWQLRKAKYARFLKRIEPLYDVAFLNSREDVDALARLWPRSKLVHIANGLDLGGYPTGIAEPVADRLIYPGSIGYPPNRDAVSWFADEILPTIRAARPGVELRITGAVPDGIVAPQGPGIVYTGRVADIREEIAAAMATVVPLRLGAGGARFKVIESLALGTPLVGTAIGIEGLELVDGTDYLKAETAGDFAAAVLRLLEDRSLRDRIAAAGRARMERDYDWRVLFASLEERLMSAKPRQRAIAI